MLDPAAGALQSGRDYFSCIMNCAVPGSRRVRHLSLCHRLGCKINKKENKRPESCTSEQTSVCLYAARFAANYNKSRFQLCLPLTSHHGTMSVWLFSSRSAAQRSAPAEHLFYKYSSSVVHETCSLQGDQPGQVPNSLQAHSHYVLSDCAKTQLLLQLPEENEATLRPAVFVLARGLVFCDLHAAYSYGDTMHGVGRMPAGLSATRSTATELTAMYFQHGRITPTIYCDILSGCSPSRQIVDTHIRISILQTLSWR